ncbi:MAG TPA: hypothetical protein VHC91_08535 [Trinickia sp.]|uniref:hypothetical protein n=1 Tax=Trinickia sp. TaxID=2571163 RepID=UPI002B7A6DC0|nr:hypothetical protein [Trinickia sp.]HVW50441.1 hypothetical protein [Trinickia sp.]
MYDAITPEMIETIDKAGTLADTPASDRRPLAHAALGLEQAAAGIATQAVKLADPMARQSATTVADGLSAAAQLCRAAIDARSE